LPHIALGFSAQSTVLVHEPLLAAYQTTDEQAHYHKTIDIVFNHNIKDNSIERNRIFIKKHNIPIGKIYKMNINKLLN